MKSPAEISTVAEIVEAVTERLLDVWGLRVVCGNFGGVACP